MTYEVVVSGGGVVGLCAAIAMAQRGYCVAILDGGDFNVPAQEDFRRVYAINAGSMRLLTDLGVRSCLEMTQCAPYRQMEVRDQSSTGRIAFDCRHLAMPELGHIMGEITLKKALIAVAARQPRLSLLAGQTIQRLLSNTDGIELHTQTQTLKPHLLMVAEGAHSTTRELLNVPLHHYSYHQQALIAQVACEQPHQHVARQIFLPSGPLAFLPLPDSHQCSIVWSTRPAQAKHLQALANDAFNARLAEAFDHQLGKVELMGARFCFPLHMRHVQQYSAEHWLLLGDTAHTIHPLAGLGLNLGLADVQAWLDCMTSAPARGFSPHSLAAFQRQRKTEVWKVIMMMQGLKSLFQNPLPPFIHLRAIGLNTVNRLSPIKKFLMKQAAGI